MVLSSKLEGKRKRRKIERIVRGDGYSKYVNLHFTKGQRDRETERQRDRETERQRDRETERQRDRETERQRDTLFVDTILDLHNMYVELVFYILKYTQANLETQLTFSNLRENHEI